jgi:hypothetical protein
MPSSSYEVLTVRALKALFPSTIWQERVRPDFLKYTTGRNLELDLYHEPFKLAIEVQGPHHYRSVDGLASPEQSQAQQDRDTFKRHRCAEGGIKLYTVSIFDLSFERLYRLYVDLHHSMPIKSLPMPRMLFERIPEVQAVNAEADRLSRRRIRPHGAKRRPYRKPGFIPLLQRLLRR